MLRALRALRLAAPRARAPLLFRAFSASASGGAATASPPSSSERVAGAATKHTFQAETKQLLNIVANSLYTDKHVFIRCVARPPSRPRCPPPPAPPPPAPAPLLAYPGTPTPGVLKLGATLNSAAGGAFWGFFHSPAWGGL
jgi:hypothetical protein